MTYICPNFDFLRHEYFSYLAEMGFHTFPSQTEWNSHPELSGRLACYSPVAGYTGKPQMSASRTSEASRTDVQCAEEQAFPHVDHHILGNGFGLAIDESISLTRANIVFGQCSHLVQTGESGDSRMLSETVRVYGISSCGVSARASTYETSSAMAEIPGAKQSMEERSVACLGDSQMHADARPLVQHKDVRARSLDGQSGQQKNRHYRCVIGGLGRAINHLGGIRSHSLQRLAERFLLWADRILLSIRAVHVPGSQNCGTNMLFTGSGGCTHRLFS